MLFSLFRQVAPDREINDSRRALNWLQVAVPSDVLKMLCMFVQTSANICTTETPQSPSTITLASSKKVCTIEAVVQLVGTSSVKEINTKSNSTIDTDGDVDKHDGQTADDMAFPLHARTTASHHYRQSAYHGRRPRSNDDQVCQGTSRESCTNAKAGMLVENCAEGDIYSDVTRLTNIYHNHYHRSI